MPADPPFPLAIAGFAIHVENHNAVQRNCRKPSYKSQTRAEGLFRSCRAFQLNQQLFHDTRTFDSRQA